MGNNLSANNATGFSALPAGYYYYDGSDDYVIYGVGSYTYFWSATPEDEDDAYEWYLSYSNDYLYYDSKSRYFGQAVRCVQNMVTTDSASHITSSSATLHGTILLLDENASATVGFQYGHTRNAMESTVTVGNVTGIGPFSFDINGLDAATVYFRAFVANGEDTVWGGVKFFTPISTMSVTTDSATHINHRSATLHGTINGMSNPEATTAGFVYGTAENALTNSVAESMSVTGDYDCRIINLSNPTTYYYKAFETDGTDTTYGEVKNFTTSTLFICGSSSIDDHEGNLYTTVQIGTQCWTKQNMRCTTAPDGTVTLGNGYGTHSYYTPYYYEPTGSVTTYGNTYTKEEYVEKFGRLYNYPAAMANNQATNFDYPHRGICPEGWHVPTDEEWKTMATFVYNSTAPVYKCPDCSGSINGSYYYNCIGKALADSTDWDESSSTCAVGNNLSANNATGFSALPAGYYYYDGSDDYGIYGVGSYTYFWSSTPYSESDIYYWELFYFHDYLYHDSDSRYYGFSVRCIHDSAKLGVTTDSVSNVNTHTATLNGTVTEIDDELVSFAGFQYGHSESDMENRLVYGQMTSPGSFSSNIDILDASTVYYRAFVSYSEGIVWGEIKHFTPIADMSVVTNSATNIISSSATLHGTINGMSNPDATIAGFIYGTDQNSLSSSVETSVSVTGNYSINTGGLTPSTTYYYQAFESDGEETVLGEVLSFTTVEPMAVTTDSLQIVEGNIIKLYGTINYLGGHAAVSAGFKYGTSQDELNTTVAVGAAITTTGVFSCVPTRLSFNTIYYYQAFVAYDADTVLGDIKTFISPMTFDCGYATVQDVDNNTYNTVKIGSQCWLKENLKTTNGLTKGTHYFYPANDTANVKDYGLLYTWNTANQNTSSTSSSVQGICPPGWRMPSDSDVYTLTKYVFDNYRCEDCSSSQWVERADCVAPALASKYGWNTFTKACAIGNNLSQNDTTGFSAVPAGICTNGNYTNFKLSAFFWTSASRSNSGYFFRMHADHSDVWVEADTKSRGCSVRCLYDIDTRAIDLSVVTDIVTDKLDRSALLHGNVNGARASSPVTAGFKYGTSQNTLNATVTKSEPITTAESYSCQVVRLNPTTTYYYKAFAVSGTDTVWGEVKSFVAEASMSVTTDSADNITHNSAILHGTVTFTDSSLSAQAGFVYGTDPDALNLSQSVNISQVGAYDVRILQLTPDTPYYYKAFLVMDDDTIWGNQTKEFTTAFFYYFKPCVSDPTVTDDMGNVYPTVQIGTQCWMAQNMRTTQSVSPEDRKYPNNDSLNVDKYGYLYSWEAATNNNTNSVNPAQGICPTGWQIPYEKDLDTLTTYLKRHSEFWCDNTSDFIAKSLASQEGWTENQFQCCVGFDQKHKNGATGFNAYPDGGWNNSEEFSYFGKNSRFWLYNENNVTDKKTFRLSYQSKEVTTSILSRNYTFYFPVRCVRIERAEELPVPSANMSVITLDADPVMTYSATINGRVEAIGESTSVAAGFRYGVSEEAMDSIVTIGNLMRFQNFSYNITNLDHSETRYYQAFVTDDIDTVWGDVLNFTTLILCGIDSITDIDNNTYSTVKIGTQCWMQSNLRTKRYANGGTIAGDAKIYHVKDDETNDATYGLLYNWAAVMDTAASSNANPSGVQGICPDGWHVPSDAEWTQMTNYVANKYPGISVAKALLLPLDWMVTPASEYIPYNITNFSALPVGYYITTNEGFGQYADFYSATQSDASNALRVELSQTYNNLLPREKSRGYSVRCLYDSVSPITMYVTTNHTDNITNSTATLHGVLHEMGEGHTFISAGFKYGTSAVALDREILSGAAMETAATYSCKLTGLTEGTPYYYRAFATAGNDTVWGDVHNFVIPFLCGLDSVTDIDNNTYSTVKIGTQCWMQSNLRTKRYADGGAIDSDAFHHIKGDASNDATYGLLYNWAAVMGTEASSNANPSGVQGICPDGWHIPSDTEWTQLTNYVNSKSIYLCSSENKNYVAPALASNKNGDWTYSIRECAVGNHPSNATGFSALPAGSYSSSGYASFGENADFWSATQSSASNAHRRDLNYTWESVFDYTADKTLGYSVRCLSDSVFPITMHVTTDNSDNTMSTSAILHGTLHEMGKGHTSVKVGFKYGISADDLDREIVSGAALRTPSAYSCKLTGLTNGTDYYYRAFATADNDTVWGNIQTVHSFICGVEKLTDIDNNKYATVQIGAQCWMAENLRTMADLYYVAPNKDYNNVSTYGLLYTWNTATQRQASDEAHPMVQGICPKGWHIPSKDEWETMTKYVFDQSYYRCGSCSTWEENTGCISKALASTTGWRTSANNPCLPGSDTSTNNSTGFNAVPAGGFFNNVVFSDTIYYDFHSLAKFHTSSIFLADLDYAWNVNIYADSLNLKYGKDPFWDYSYLSVRCVADFTYLTVATDSCHKVSSETALLYGTAKLLGDNDEVTVGFKYGKNESDLNQIVTKTVVGVGPYTCSIGVLNDDSTYYYKAFMTNGIDTVWGETLSFSNVEFACGTDKIYDIEGNSYATIQIGAQCWMAENLRKTEGMEYDSDYFYPDGHKANVGSHGLLYTFNAVTRNDSTNIQGICPDGWHIPSDDDWDQMTNYVFGQTQYRCGTCDQWEQETHCIANAMASTTGWESSTNSCVPGNVLSYNAKTGFNAMPAGYYQNWVTSKYHYFGEYACFWTSTCDPTAAYYYQLSYDKDNILRDHNKKTSFTLAASIRCIIDNMAVSTDNPSNVLYHSATLNGTVKSLGAYSSVTIGFRYGTATDELNTVVENDSPITAPSSYSRMLNLLPETTYYYQAFGTNGSDTVWGTIKNFTTPASTSVTTDDAGNVTYHSATLNATINELGGYPNVWTGFKYGTEPNNLSQKIMSNVASHEIGTYNCVPTDLMSETAYYYQAFVFNETDTIYGEVESFTTKGISEVATDSTFQITNNATSLYGTVKNLGGCSSVTVGFKYGTNADALQNVVTCDEMLTNVGTFSYKIAHLSDSTSYYYP